MMIINHCFTDDNFRDIGSRWLDVGETDFKAIAEHFDYDEYEGFGCGEYSLSIEKLLRLPDHKSGKLLIEGIYSFLLGDVRMFKKVAVIISENKGTNDAWYCNDISIDVQNGTIQEVLSDNPYSADQVYKRLEKFGYDYCNDWCDCHGHQGLKEWMRRYEEEKVNGETEGSFAEWFKTAELINEEQLPEPEFPGLHWTYSNFLDWDSMTESVYNGAERWRVEQLRFIEEEK